MHSGLTPLFPSLGTRAQDASSGSGLRGLGDRVGALDGTPEVRSPRGEGTLIRAVFPLL